MINSDSQRFLTKVVIFGIENDYFGVITSAILIQNGVFWVKKFRLEIFINGIIIRPKICCFFFIKFEIFGRKWPCEFLCLVQNRPFFIQIIDERFLVKILRNDHVIQIVQYYFGPSIQSRLVVTPVNIYYLLSPNVFYIRSKTFFSS